MFGGQLCCYFLGLRSVLDRGLVNFGRSLLRFGGFLTLDGANTTNRIGCLRLGFGLFRLADLSLVRL